MFCFWVCVVYEGIVSDLLVFWVNWGGWGYLLLENMLIVIMFWCFVRYVRVIFVEFLWIMRWIVIKFLKMMVYVELCNWWWSVWNILFMFVLFECVVIRMCLMYFVFGGVVCEWYSWLGLDNDKNKLIIFVGIRGGGVYGFWFWLCFWWIF